MNEVCFSGFYNCMFATFILFAHANKMNENGSTAPQMRSFPVFTLEFNIWMVLSPSSPRAAVPSHIRKHIHLTGFNADASVVGIKNHTDTVIAVSVWYSKQVLIYIKTWMFTPNATIECRVWTTTTTSVVVVVVPEHFRCSSLTTGI